MNRGELLILAMWFQRRSRIEFFTCFLRLGMIFIPNRSKMIYRARTGSTARWMLLF